MSLWNKNMPYGATNKDCEFIGKGCLDMFVRCDTCKHNTHNKSRPLKSYYEAYICENCGEEIKPNKQSKVYDNRFCDFDCRNGWFNGEQMKSLLNSVKEKLK